MKPAAAGFSLVELLIAVTIMTMITGAVLVMVTVARSLFRTQAEAADLQQRLRVAVDTLQKDLLMAGAGPSIGRAAGPLHASLAPVLPYRTGERNPDPASGVFHRRDVISLLYVPPTSAQAVVQQVTLAGGLLAITAAPNCGSLAYDRLCGFTPGTPVLVFDDAGQADSGIIASVDGTTVSVEGPGLRGRVDPGGHAMLVEVTQHTYWLDAGAAVPRLMHYDGRETDSPVIDHVVDLRFDYFGDPRPPALLPQVDLAGEGPWTTYGPKPPPIGRDDPRDAWAAGENCTFSVADGVHVPRLAALGAGRAPVPLGTAQLTDGPWCPDAGDPVRFDADLLRIRRVRVIVRVQAGAATMRGRAGPWFRRGGTPVSAFAVVPDQEIQLDVSPRNLARTP